MRRFLQSIFTKPVAAMAKRYSSKPNLQRVHEALSKLYAHTLEHPGKKGLLLPMNTATDRFIIFSDQHKGAKNGSDDFRWAEVFPGSLGADRSKLADLCFKHQTHRVLLTRSGCRSSVLELKKLSPALLRKKGSGLTPCAVLMVNSLSTAVFWVPAHSPVGSAR